MNDKQTSAVENTLYWMFWGPVGLVSLVMLKVPFALLGIASGFLFLASRCTIHGASKALLSGSIFLYMQCKRLWDYLASKKKKRIILD